MRPVASGIAGGLLLSLVVVAGVTLLSGVGSLEGAAPSVKQDLHNVLSATTAATTMTTTTATASTTGPPPQAALQSATTATSGQTKSWYTLLLTLLPVAAALALGAFAYLISRSRIEKES